MMRRRWIGYVAAALCCVRATWAVDPAVLDAEQQRVAQIEKVAPSVVAVFTASGDGGGSGVLISPDGYALSNFHVTSGAGDFMKAGLNDGKLYDAVIVGIDPTGDVALIKLLGRDDFPVAKLGDSDRLRVGEWVYVMGNPFLLATDFRPTVTTGIVSGVHRYQYPAGTILEYTDCIQTDASINPGNSGGPLFNAAGELVGINGRGSFEKRGRVNVGAGYAISINQIKHFLDALRGGRVVDHATLGATVRTGRDREVLIDQILEQSSAYRRGLREDDEIVSFGGRPIGSVNQFKNVLGIYPDGWKVPLVYRREGQRHEILVELRALHRQSELKAGPQKPQPKKPGKDDPKPDDPRQPRKPGDPPALGEKPAIEPPAAWKHLFEAKPGFANYYFNRQEQERALRGLSTFGSLAAHAGRWKLSGTIGDGTSFVLTLAETTIGLKIGEKRVYLQPLDGSDPLDEPPDTGGFLIALEQLKTLLTVGREGFSEVTYLGSEPLDGVGTKVDIVATLRGSVQTRWFFQQTDGQLLGFDAALGTDVDPASVRFGPLGDLGGRPFPQSWIVRSGDREFARFHISSAEFLPSPPKREER